MEQLLITVEDVKNELDLDLARELGMQPKQTDKWLARVQRTIMNHIADYVGGISQAESLLLGEKNKAVVQQAIIEQIDYLASNNFVQANNVMNTDDKTVKPVIAPLAHQLLLNAGLIHTEK